MIIRSYECRCSAGNHFVTPSLKNYFLEPIFTERRRVAMPIVRTFENRCRSLSSNPAVRTVIFVVHGFCSRGEAFDHR